MEETDMTSSGSPAIEVRGLAKRFGEVQAVAGIDFDVREGEVFGFLGPNGAGKTTLIKVLLGLVRGHDGQARLFGHPPGDPASRRRVGYLPEAHRLPGYLTGRQVMELFGMMCGRPRDFVRDRVPKLLEHVEMSHAADRKVREYSKGMQQRIGLAQAMLGDPRLVFLDEPTDGLDPNQKHEVRELINDMAKNKIIVISTHVLEEVDAVCNRAMIISQGRILADDTPQHLEQRSKFHNAVSLKLADAAQLPQVREQLAALNEVGEVAVDRNTQRITAFPASGHAPFMAISRLAQAQNWNVAELHLESGRLDEVFRTITANGGAAA